MRRQFPVLPLLAFAVTLVAAANTVPAQDTQAPAPGQEPDATVETAGEHARVETVHGALHLWIPDRYEARSAGLVIYIHGYYTNVDQTWTNDHLDAQFQASERNALFVVIDAPMSNFQDVSWKSLGELLRAVQDLTPFPFPRGPLVVVGHSGAFRTILLWLRDPRVQYLILLDGLYTGLGDYRAWLRPRPHTKPHRLVLVAADTWRQSSQLARRTPGSARRRGIPSSAAAFTPRQAHARLLYLTSQYNHMDMVSSGKVIPVLLQITPLDGFSTVRRKPHAAPPASIE